MVHSGVRAHATVRWCTGGACSEVGQHGLHTHDNVVKTGARTRLPLQAVPDQASQGRGAGVRNGGLVALQTRDGGRGCLQRGHACSEGRSCRRRLSPCFPPSLCTQPMGSHAKPQHTPHLCEDAEEDLGCRHPRKCDGAGDQLPGQDAGRVNVGGLGQVPVLHGLGGHVPAQEYAECDKDFTGGQQGCLCTSALEFRTHHGACRGWWRPLLTNSRSPHPSLITANTIKTHPTLPMVRMRVRVCPGSIIWDRPKSAILATYPLLLPSALFSSTLAAGTR